MSEETKPKRNKINWTTDKIMSTSALFISVISLIALLYQSYLAREENELIQKQQSASVLPHLSQWYSNSLNEFQYIVGNKGVGPAFIKDLNIVLDSIHKFDNSDELFRHLFKTTKSLDTIPYSHSTFMPGTVLPANETIKLITIKGRKEIMLFQQALANYDLEFSIIYQDVYGTQWVLSNKNDSNVPVLISKE
jgi:hypothetical protein